jgi:hypothetical protein
MPLSEGSLAKVRTWVGTEAPTDLELQAIYATDGFGTPKAVVEGVLRQRLADFLAEHAQLSAAGVITLGSQANIVGLQKELELLAAQPDNLGWDDETGELTPFGIINVQRMVRVGYRR